MSKVELAEYQARFRRDFAAIVEGSCPQCAGRLIAHDHDGETWGCCLPCQWAYRAHSNREDKPGFTIGEPIITSTGTRLWH